MSSTSNKSVGVAIALIVLGSVLLLAQLDLLFIPWYIFTWQTIIIAVGIFNIVGKNNWEFGLSLVAIGGVLLYARVEHIPYRELWDYWPAVLILIGITMLIRMLKIKSSNSNQEAK